MILNSSTAPINGLIKGLVLAGIVLAVGACTATERTADNPILRKFQWFSYLEGGDFKEACQPGAPDHYRLVYNGIYTEQVRVYDLRADTDRLDARLILPMDIRNFAVDGVSDLLNPWRGTPSSTTISATERKAIVAALDADGAFGPPAVGLDLPSMGFFWTIAACHEGAYHFTGLTWPSAAWDALRFDDALFAVDPIRAAVNPPRKTDVGRNLTSGRRSINDNDFIVQVGAHGLTGF